MNQLRPFESSKIPFRVVEIPSDEAPSAVTSAVPFRPIKLEDTERSLLGQTGRIAGQIGLGAAEQAALPYELSVAPLASEEAQLASYRQTLFDDLERLQDQKAMGQWDDTDQKLYESIVEQIKDPEKSKKYIKTADIGIRDLAEKITGQDLAPENFLERAASWIGFIKNPANIKELFKSGINPKEIVKNLGITSKEIGRGIGAATGFELAQANNLGPIGQMASEIIGDVVGGKVSGAIKQADKLITKPKETIAKLAAKSVPKESLEAQKDIIKDFRKQNIQADLGTITDNNLSRMIQARLAASGLTGKPLENFQKKLTQEIKDSYKSLADTVGESRFQTFAQAGEFGREMVTKLRDMDKMVFDDLYKKFRERVQGTPSRPAIEVNPTGLALAVKKLERTLSPGEVKSPQQRAVLSVLSDIKKDIFDENRKIKNVSVSSLLNNKAALNDLIDYEVQGGQKKLLSSLVGEISRLIATVGTKDPEALKLLTQAEKKFAEHAKTYRNDLINRLITKEDPAILMNQMNSIAGIRAIKKALDKTPAGKQFFADVSRLKFDEMVGKKMTDNVSEQIKLGTFSNLLKNPKEKQIVKELLGDKAFKQLENLQKISGKLAQSADKFFNASKSGTTLIDFGLIGSFVQDLGFLLSGNPWGLKTMLTVGSGRYLSKLLSDDKFLKKVEDIILASDKNDVKGVRLLAQEMIPQIREAIAATTVQKKTSKEQE